MDARDREEVAALMAGLHSVIAAVVRRACIDSGMDMAELLTDLDTLYGLPDQHELTRAVQNDSREVLLGLLGRGPHGVPVTVRQDELLSVCPVRQSAEFRQDDQ
jgi:hypothetical protein